MAHPSYTWERLTGVWRSLVARVVRDDEAAGSNPVTPTNVKSRSFMGRLFTLFAGVRGSRRFETLPGQRTALTGCNVEPCGAPRRLNMSVRQYCLRGLIRDFGRQKQLQFKDASPNNLPVNFVCRKGFGRSTLRHLSLSQVLG